MTYKRDPLAHAAEEVVLRRWVAQGGEGGVIAIDKDGNVAMPFNTVSMLRGLVGPSGRTVVKIHR
jgi:beta-aspartyl-peptidase (threonine type)